ncbi:hypothetical protein L198_05017 [Cryptococcus wingfieldii CBS 7118]|uniref:MIF4G domain-containing protein n=1 Tax=Cryptococcus wingfieldii CBS 7118 TaxID=1295528 RepID=A0A1E3J216_9TREE|nr:hypothetical protein L198_05017 [Cryptococcus wingfieldii CBS 7118]ODN94166.1 hypothetical protein L198_05017 [Cryptococcus wingfieldii CBS 7118]
MTPGPLNTTDNQTGTTSAWARGPPNKAPSAPNNAPSGTSTPSHPAPVLPSHGPSAIPIGGGGHSRKNSLLVAGNGEFKKGNLAFGTVDSPTAALSSSPAAPSMTGGHLSDAVRSFGSIDAADKQDGPDAISSRRSSVLGNAAAGPSQGKKLGIHALFSSKAPQPHTAPQPQPVMSPPQHHHPPAPIHHNRRQSFGHNGGAFQQPMAGSPNQHFVGSPHMRPPGAHPRSPVPNHNMPFNPSAPQQIQHGFRPPQQPQIRPNNMPRGGPGQYGMHSGPQGLPYPIMGFPQGNFYPGAYNPYEQHQQQQNFGGPPSQWVPQQSQSPQQHFGSGYPPSAPGPVSPRAQSQMLSPPTQSPLPPPPAVANEGTSPVPTPPMRPPSLMSSHHHSLSNASVASIPHQSTGSTVGGPSTYLSGNATNFAPRKSAAVKISRPDGTALDLENIKEAAKPAEAASSTNPVSASTTPGSEVLKKRALPTVVRIESEEQRQKRMAEEARAKELKNADDIAEKERKERMERKAKDEQEKKDKEAKDKSDKDASEKAAADAKKAEDEKKRFEAALAAQAAAAKKVEEEKAAAVKAALEKSEKAEEEKAKAHAATLEARSKAEEQLRAIVETPSTSVTPSPMGSPALGAGLPAKPVAALGAAKRTPPSALNLATASESPAPLTASASALTSARPIDDITSVNYPHALLSPSIDLNKNAEPGKFRYDRGFLMQFMNVCREKPESLPPLEDLGLDVDGASGFGGRGGSSRGSRSSMGPSSRVPGGAGATGLGVTGARSSYPNSFGTGQFGSGPGSLRGSTSESRYHASLGPRAPSGRGAPGGIGSFSGLPSMGITNSRNGASRGSQRGSKRVPSQAMAPPAPAIPISENAWTRTRLGTNDESSPAFIERKVKALLNKLTEEKFDPISKQILEWANKSANEEDHMTLKLVIKLIFEKATDEAHWSAMYAKLCRLIHDQLDQAVTETTADNKVYSGRALFRRYLLGRCQQDFQSGWKAREDTAVAAAAKEKEDGAKVAEKEMEKKPEGGEEKEAVLLSDEYYAAQKAKRRGLGLVQLIGEMYKLDILTYRVITECLTKLLANFEKPDEEDVESACKLLTTVGDKLVKANPDLLDGSFTALEKILKNDDLPSRIRFMIMDVQDLRRDGFRSQKNQSSVMTIAEIHKQAAKEKNAASARESMSRGGSRAGGRRDPPQQPGDWQAVPGGPRVAGRPVDFAGIGRGLSSSARTSSPSFAGPTSVFSRKGGNTASPAPPVSRSTSSNMFSALTDGQDNTGSSASRRDSADAGEPTPQRKRLSLAPRTKPVPTEGDEEEDPQDGEGGESGESEEDLSEEQAKEKINLDMKELWGEKDQGGSRNPGDVVEYFTSLPQNLRHLLAARLLEDVFRLSKPRDAEVVAKGWKAALEAQAVPVAVFKETLEERVVSLDDDAVDFPGAYKAVGELIRSLSLADEEIQNLISKIEVYGQPRVTPQQKLEKALKEIDGEA